MSKSTYDKIMEDPISKERFDRTYAVFSEQEEILEKIEKDNILIENHIPAFLLQDRTGLPMIIGIIPKLRFRKPFVLVQTDYSTKVSANNCRVLVSSKPKIISGKIGSITLRDISKVYEFIVKNKLAIKKVWKEEIDYMDFVLDQMKKVDK